MSMILKILNYLFLEFSKQESFSNNSNWNSFRIDCKKITHFHKDFFLLVVHNGFFLLDVKDTFSEDVVTLLSNILSILRPDATEAIPFSNC